MGEKGRGARGAHFLQGPHRRGFELARAVRILETDASRIMVNDSLAEAVAAVTDVAVRRFGLPYGPRVKRRWILAE